MTEKELHRLSRQDLLQLLLAQSKEVSRQRVAIEGLKSNAEEDRALTDRLKAKLDEKDETIEHLKQRLDGKDETIAHLKRRLDAKDETMNKMKADTESMLETVEFLRSRLDEKDVALDAVRARLDRMSGVEMPELPATTPPAGHESGSADDIDARLQELKNRIAESTAAEFVSGEEA